MFCAIWWHLYNFKNVKNTHGGVLPLIACNFTKSKTPPWVFFTFFKLYLWYQIAKSITIKDVIRLNCSNLNDKFNWQNDFYCTEQALAKAIKTLKIMEPNSQNNEVASIFQARSRYLGCPKKISKLLKPYQNKCTFSFLWLRLLLSKYMVHEVK